MAQLTVVYWRDIPAQVIVKQARNTAKRQLSDLYQKAIDAAAMKAGAADTDAYLNDWRRGAAQQLDGDIEALADQALKDLEAAYGPDRLKALIADGGRETP
jgi:hypothetical protein